MAKYHLIKNGVVENSVLWDAPPPPSAYPGYSVVASESAAPGWIWDGTNFAPPAPPVAPVPVAISRLQLILGMTSEGLIPPAEGLAAAAGTGIPAVVDAVFASLPAAEATAARIRWSAMTEVERANPLVAAVATAAGKSPADMDQYFRSWRLL